MKIVMDDQQYQELETLVDIFDEMFFDEEEVRCFCFIKEIVDNGYDINNIQKERKEQMQKQMIEAFEWLECLNVNLIFKNKFLSCFLL